MIGEKLSPVLKEIEDTLWEFEYDYPEIKPEYTTEGFRAACKIFMSAMTDKMFENIQVKGMIQKEAEIEAQQLGEELRKLVLTYTGIDTFDLYSETQTQF